VIPTILSGKDVFSSANQGLLLKRPWHYIRGHLTYRELDSKYDIHGVLRRPYGKHKLSFWEILNRLIAQRHDLIHRAELDAEYTPVNLRRDLDLTWKALWRVYQELVKINNWQPVEKWEI
jgi:hypothetical protein